MVSKQTLINTELSPFKTCVYLILITLFFSDGTQLLCARHSKRWRHSRTHSVREINSFPDPDQYGLFICCNASYSETEVRITSNVLSRIIAAFLLLNVFGIRTSRGQAVVCTNCLSFSQDLPASLSRAIYFLPNCEKPRRRTKCELLMHAACILNECTSYRSYALLSELVRILVYHS